MNNRKMNNHLPTSPNILMIAKNKGPSSGWKENTFKKRRYLMIINNVRKIKWLAVQIKVVGYETTTAIIKKSVADSIA
jgi:hypothetical protein